MHERVAVVMKRKDILRMAKQTIDTGDGRTAHIFSPLTLMRIEDDATNDAKPSDGWAVPGAAR